MTMTRIKPSALTAEIYILTSPKALHGAFPAVHSGNPLPIAPGPGYSLAQPTRGFSCTLYSGDLLTLHTLCERSVQEKRGVYSER